MKKNKIIPVYDKGTMVKITARHCSEKIQKDVIVGECYIVIDNLTLPSGVPAVYIKSIHGGRAMRINANRFSWKKTSLEKAAASIVDEHKVTIYDGQMKEALLQKYFSDQMIKHILWTPFLYMMLAWYYIELCRTYARENGLNYRKQSSFAVNVKREIDNDAIKAIGSDSLNEWSERINMLVEEKADAFNKIWWQVNGEVKRVAPNIDDTIIATYAAIATMIADVMLKHECASAKSISTKTHGMVNYSMKTMLVGKIESVAKAYAEDVCMHINFKRLEASERVIMSYIEAFKFQ